MDSDFREDQTLQTQVQRLSGLPDFEFLATRNSWNSENSKNEALIIGLVGDLFITTTLETVEDLRNVEWRYA